MIEYSEYSECILCATEGFIRQETIEGPYFSCKRCGEFRADNSVESYMQSVFEEMGEYPDDTTWILVSHQVRKRFEEESQVPTITEEWLEYIAENELLPTPKAQADNLILWVGEKFKTKSHEWVGTTLEALPAVMGGKDYNSVQYITSQLRDSGFIAVQEAASEIFKFRLSLEGWSRFEKLKRNPKNNKIAFMAMPFGHEDLTQQFFTHYAPTVKATGFNLQRLDENPEAGSVINRMKVAIRNSRFLVCELTGNNNGAYWEAGFAEGLGKKVIFLCKRKAKAKKRPHFDIQSDQIIFWTEDTLSRAMEELKAAIRNSFPNEAVMEDTVSQEV